MNEYTYWVAILPFSYDVGKRKQVLINKHPVIDKLTTVRARNIDHAYSLGRDAAMCFRNYQ